MPDPAAPPSQPANAFDPAFLALLRQRDEPAGALEAETGGDWFVEGLSTGGFALYRNWQSWSAGHAPAGIFAAESDALLAAAVRPAMGRDPLFFQDSLPTSDGYFLLRAVRGSREGLRVAGALRHVEEATLPDLNLAAYLARHPQALALILEAGGPGVIETTGEILAVRLGVGWPAPGSGRGRVA